MEGKGMANYMRIMAEQRTEGNVKPIEPRRKPTASTMKFIKDKEKAKEKK